MQRLRLMAHTAVTLRAADWAVNACHVWDLWRVLCLPARVFLWNEHVRQPSGTGDKTPTCISLDTGLPTVQIWTQLTTAFGGKLQQWLYQTKLHDKPFSHLIHICRYLKINYRYLQIFADICKYLLEISLCANQFFDICTYFQKSLIYLQISANKLEISVKIIYYRYL